MIKEEDGTTHMSYVPTLPSDNDLYNPRYDPGYDPSNILTVNNVILGTRNLDDLSTDHPGDYFINFEEEEEEEIKVVPRTMITKYLTSCLFHFPTS